MKASVRVSTDQAEWMATLFWEYTEQYFSQWKHTKLIELHCSLETIAMLYIVQTDGFRECSVWSITIYISVLASCQQYVVKCCDIIYMCVGFLPTICCKM